MTVEKTFAAIGDSAELLVAAGRTMSYQVTGTFVGTVQIVEVVDGALTVVDSITSATPLNGSVLVTPRNSSRSRFRFRCIAYTSGSPACTMTDAAEVSVDVPPGVFAKEMVFVETGAAAVYVASVAIPAGASIHDIIVNGVAQWDNAGNATLKVGDVANDAGYFSAVNLKATDLLTGESLSFDEAGGKPGAYIANSQVSPRYAVAARTVKATITTTGAGGSAGRTRVLVVYSVSADKDLIGATKT